MKRKRLMAFMLAGCLLLNSGMSTVFASESALNTAQMEEEAVSENVETGIDDSELTDAVKETLEDEGEGVEGNAPDGEEGNSSNIVEDSTSGDEEDSDSSIGEGSIPDNEEDDDSDGEEDSTSNVGEDNASNTEEGNTVDGVEDHAASISDNSVIGEEDQDMTMDDLMVLPVDERLAKMTSDDDIASDTTGDIAWVINADGKLTIVGTGEYLSGRYYAPWCDKNEYIKSAEVNLTNTVDASRMFRECHNLTSLNLSGFDTSHTTSMCAMFYGCSNLTSLDLSGFNTSNVTNMNKMFRNCSSLTSLDLSGFNTSSVTDMNEMFWYCTNLTSLDLSGFDTSNVTNMNSMFGGCTNLTSLDLSGFSTSSVTDMGGMFVDCSSLTSLDMSDFDTSKVTGMDNMFGNCSSLTSLDVSGFDTSKVTGMSGMFRDCSSLTSLDVSSFDTSKVTNMDSMFMSCSSLMNLDVSGFDTSNVTGMNWMFHGGSSLTSLDVSGFDTSNVTGMYWMFWSCSSLTNLDVSGFDTSNVTNMFGMFMHCSNLASLDVSGFDTSSVTNMYGMFDGCSSLTSLDVSSFNTSNVTDMRDMFLKCFSLTSLDLSSFVTSNVTYMGRMFMYCTNLTSLDVSGFDTSNVTDMSGMFGGCSSLTSLDLRSFDTSNVTNMGGMFCACKSLTNINLSSFDTSNVENMCGMFCECYSLTSLDLSSFNAINLGGGYDSYYMFLTMNSDNTYTELDIWHMFGECTSLKTISTPKNVKISVGLTWGTTWLMPDGTQITELPQNLNESVRITKAEDTTNEPFINVTKTKTEYICGETLNLDDITVTYNDGLGNETKVTAYTTNAADIDMSTAGEKQLVITYSGLTQIVNITVKEKEGSGTGDSGNTGENGEPENKEGLKINFSEPGKEYIYTGSAITPAISVTNNGKSLVEGTDYTIKYSGNTKATDNAKVVISGKGNLTGKSQTLTFKIKKKLLNNSDLSAAIPAVESDIVTVVEGSKVSPVLIYNGVKLSNNKDFTLSNSDKNHKWQLNESNQTITVTGKGNFEGTKTLKVVVISKAEQKNCKIKVNVTKGFNGYTYDGTPKDFREHLSVSTAQTPSEQLEEFKDYVISYPADITNTGTKKITITGISDRCMGSVTKSYKINPKKVDFTTEYNTDGYSFVSGGTKVYDLIVKVGDTELSEGRDYKVTYSSNKKVGSNAKFTVTGMGNYKGSKCTKTFTIKAVTLNNNPNSNSEMTKGLKIAVGDMVFKKEGLYKSTPYIDLNGVTLKKSDYTVSYYLDDPRTNPNAEMMDKNHKVKAGNTTVWVKIVGKGNYASTDSTCYAIGSYKVCTKQAQGYDLSKAKISFKDSNGKAIKKIDYTGNPIKDDTINVVVTCKINGTDTVLNPENYTVDFVNNVNKGKAVVIIKGAEDQTAYVGSKTASFSIVAKNIYNLIRLFTGE